PGCWGSRTRSGEAVLEAGASCGGLSGLGGRSAGLGPVGAGDGSPLLRGALRLLPFRLGTHDRLCNQGCFSDDRWFRHPSLSWETVPALSLSRRIERTLRPSAPGLPVVRDAPPSWGGLFHPAGRGGDGARRKYLASAGESDAGSEAC